MSNMRRRVLGSLKSSFGSRQHTKRKHEPAFFRPSLDLLEDRTLLDVALTSIPTWTEQGPGKIINPFTSVNTSATAAGTTGPITTIAAEPGSSVLCVGTPGGGIWKSSLVNGQRNWT